MAATSQNTADGRTAVAIVINDNQPGRTALIEITADPPTLEVGTKLYMEPNTGADPRVADNDRDEITVTLDGKELRGWSYSTDQERRVKMLCAREFVEGFCAGRGQ